MDALQNTDIGDAFGVEGIHRLVDQGERRHGEDDAPVSGKRAVGDGGGEHGLAPAGRRLHDDPPLAGARRLCAADRARSPGRDEGRVPSPASVPERNTARPRRAGDGQPGFVFAEPDMHGSVEQIGGNRGGIGTMLRDQTKQAEAR